MIGIYGRDVSDGINVRFCAYCTYSLGIDKPSQKMHDDEIRKVDMWLVVEELRIHQLVIA